MGCGYYVQRAHPSSVAAASEEQLAEEMIEQIQNGFGSSGIRPGIIGELGTSSTLHPHEMKVLKAAARAQRATGLALNVHVAIFGGRALEVLEILDQAGADLTRVVVSHLDELLDRDYHHRVLSLGAFVEFDTFGSEFYFDDDGSYEPSDRERLEALCRLLDEGWERQLLVSQDVCTKLHLRKYGGFGYGHVLRTIVPRLRSKRIDEATVHTLLVENPARVLAV
jgi:phosphotriesterase-related protein